MNIRRLTDAGLERMEGFLRSLTTGHPELYSDQILTDAATSEALAVQIRVERRPFPRRFDVAEYLHERLGGLREPERDKRLWAWLALYWFEQLCPPDKHGKRKPGDLTRWIPRLDSSLRYYRHLLLGPYLVYKVHSEDPHRAMCILCQPIHTPGDVVEQIVARPQLVTSPAVVGAATDLYCDGNGVLRRGAGGKGAGSARRLADVIMQFDLTYDLHTLDAGRLFSMLPREFDRFRADRSRRR
jgi:hypothetical protein